MTIYHPKIWTNFQGDKLWLWPGPGVDFDTRCVIIQQAHASPHLERDVSGSWPTPELGYNRVL